MNYSQPLNTSVQLFKVVNLFMKNQCYLIHNGQAGLLIDPAWKYNIINDFLVQNGITLEAVLLTHAHPDHTDLANKFSKNHQVPVYMSDVEIAHSGFSLPHLHDLSHLQTVRLGPFDVLPIITPGHTLGSTCFLIENHLFTGDTVFIEGVGICEHRNAGSLYDSVQFLKANLHEDTLIWPGHSFGQPPGKTFHYLLNYNIYFAFNKREQFIDYRMRKNRPNPFSFK